MQVNFEHLTKNWVEFETAESGVVYLIQNRGADVLVLLETDSAPESTTKDGILVKPYQTVKYEKGEQSLFMRALDMSCSVNISTIEQND